ncbi:hypothetical protein NL676_023825 [Syzygium grande]|nr:hypothetical protein NL676_023825 [Syzygium grande]
MTNRDASQSERQPKILVQTYDGEGSDPAQEGRGLTPPLTGFLVMGERSNSLNWIWILIYRVDLRRPSVELMRIECLRGGGPQCVLSWNELGAIGGGRNPMPKTTVGVLGFLFWNCDYLTGLVERPGESAAPRYQDCHENGFTYLVTSDHPRWLLAKDTWEASQAGVALAEQVSPLSQCHGPGGQALRHAWSPVSLSVDIADMTFVLGCVSCWLKNSQQTCRPRRVDAITASFESVSIYYKNPQIFTKNNETSLLVLADGISDSIKVISAKDSFGSTPPGLVEMGAESREMPSLGKKSAS